MKDFISKHKTIITTLLCILFSEIASVSATVIVFSSSEVSYNNSESGMSSNNVQDAIDELYGVARLSDRMDELEEELKSKTDFDDVFPVGTIYISINSTNPSSKFGGTWVAYGSGKTLVGGDSSDTNFKTVEKTGGSKSIILNSSNIPAHTHTMTHTHTYSGTTGASSASNTGS